jgi:AraC-like DNA-binding protein
MLFAARQLGTDAHDARAFEEHDKAMIEDAANTFAVQEAFIRSAGCVLDAAGKLFAGRPRKLVDRVRTLIDGALEERSGAQSLSIAKIACALGISTGHLSRMFKRTTGVTLERYLMTSKVEAAKRLLLEPLENVSDIAERCGFSDPAYFARVFRKIAGCSPREYRNDPMRFATPAEQALSPETEPISFPLPKKRFRNADMSRKRLRSLKLPNMTFFRA